MKPLIWRIKTQLDVFELIIDKCRAAGLQCALSMPYFYELDAPVIFTGDVYAALAQGQSLGEAVNSENQYFSALTKRKEEDEFIPENWQSPSFYELSPLRITEKINIEAAPIFRISIMERGKELISERIDTRLLNISPNQEHAGAMNSRRRWIKRWTARSSHSYLEKMEPVRPVLRLSLPDGWGTVI